MNRKKHSIPNPNKISEQEMSFLKGNMVVDRNNDQLLKNEEDKYKGRMISMSDSFYKELNDYLKKNPTEGNRSSFIVRIVAEYIKNKTNNI